MDMQAIQYLNFAFGDHIRALVICVCIFMLARAFRK